MKRLRHVGFNPFDVLWNCRRIWFTIGLHRPRPQQSLVEQIFFVRIRCFQVVDRPFPAAIRQTPALQGAPPKLCDFGNGHDSRAYVFAALCVMRRRGEQSRRPIALSVQVLLVKRFDV